MFTGFILSFKIRSNFEVSYANTTGYSVIRTLTMIVGEMDTVLAHEIYLFAVYMIQVIIFFSFKKAKMGLYEGSLTNYAIYFLFIGLMCVIVLNLFVG
jgi:hypothetical protein